MSFQSNSFTSASLKNDTPSSSELSNTRFGSLGLVFPYPYVERGNLVFSAGFNRIKDFDRIVRFEGTQTINADSDNEFVYYEDNNFPNEGELAALSFAAAVDVSPNTSLGLAINRISGENEAINDYNLIDDQDLYEERRWTTQDTFTDEYKGAWTAVLGALVRFPRESPRVRLGATIGTGPKYSIDYVFRGVPNIEDFNQIEYDDGSLVETATEEIKDSYEMALPLELGVGFSMRPHESLLVAASTHYTAWSQTEYKDKDEDGLRSASVFETQYKDTRRLHIGVEWLVPIIALDLRAGYYTDPLPFVGPRDPDRSISADNPLINIKQDRHFFTLGAGLLFDEVVHLNIAWNKGYFEQHEGDESEDNTIQRIFVGVSYTF